MSPRNFPFLALALALSFAARPIASAGELPGVYHAWNDTDLAGLATLNGNVTVSLPVNQVSGSVDGNGNLKNLSGTIELHGAITADVTASASGGFSVEVPLAVIPLPIIPASPTTFIAPIIGVIGTVSGNVEAGARFALMEQFESTFSLSLDSHGLSANLLGDPQTVHRFAPPEVSGGTQVDLAVSVIAGITFQIVVGNIAIGGPTIVSEIGIEAAVDPLANPWWDIDATLANTISWVGPGVVLFTAPIGNPASFDVADAQGPFVVAPPAPTRWSRTYSLGSDEDVTDVHPLADGFLVTGNGSGVGNRAYLAKLGLDGVPLWEKRASAIPFNSLRPVAVTSAANGDLLLGGYTLTSGGARVQRLDANGGPLWARNVAGPASSTLQIHAMIPANDGSDGMIVAGEILIIGPNQPRPYVAQLDSTGSVVVWAKEFDPGAASPNGRFRDVIATRDGGLLLTGTMTYTDGVYPTALLAQPNMLAVKLDASHAVEFAKVIGTPYWDEAFCACEGEDGSLVIGGETPSWAAPNVHAALLVALEPDGDMKWSKVYAGEENPLLGGSSGDTPYDYLSGIVAVDGGYVVTGNTGLPNSVRDSWLFGLDWDGAATFFKSFRTDHQDEFAGLVAVGDSGYLAYGFSTKLDPLLPFPQRDFWLARTQVDGYLAFDPQLGFDCVNDAMDWGQAHAISALPMPGSLIDVALTTSSSSQGFDAVATTSTLLTP